MKLKIETVRPKERFVFFNQVFYPGIALELIQSGKVRPKLETLNITDWAEKVLGLKLGNKKHRPNSLMMRINYDHVDSLSEKRLEEPGIIVTTKAGSIIIDGNHRVARKFMDGKTTMDFYVFTDRVARANKFMQ